MSSSNPPPSYSDLKDQSNQDIRETLQKTKNNTASPPKKETKPEPPPRLDNPKRRLKSVVVRAPQGSSQAQKENQPPPAATSSSYRPTLGYNQGHLTQDIRYQPNYKPTYCSRWPKPGSSSRK